MPCCIEEVRILAHCFISSGQCSGVGGLSPCLCNTLNFTPPPPPGLLWFAEVFRETPLPLGYSTSVQSFPSVILASSHRYVCPLCPSTVTEGEEDRQVSSEHHWISVGYEQAMQTAGLWQFLQGTTTLGLTMGYIL